MRSRRHLLRRAAVTVVVLATTFATMGVGVAVMSVPAHAAPARATTPRVTTPRVTTPAWTVQAHPRPPSLRTGVYYGVACVTVNNCTAVGDWDNVTSERTLVEHWNGTGSLWTVQTSRNIATAVNNRLLGVACPGARMCMAVGASDARVLIERWNGSAWVLLTPAAPGTGQLAGVSCTSTTSCVAVGGNGSNPIAERWNGSAWSMLTVPSPVGGGALESVSCAAPGKCVAVGHRAQASSAPATLIERWNGSVWAIQQQGPNGAAQALHSVSCPVTTSCTAVGSNAGGTLIERWNGTKWTTQASPNPDSPDVFTGVDCTSPNACTAVGEMQSVPMAGPAFAARWNGSKWSVQPVWYGGLFGVSCIASVCTAAGTFEYIEPVIQRSYGSDWQRMLTPAPYGQANDALSRITCLSTNDCVAVGASGSFATPLHYPLAEHWNGSAWSLQPSETPAHGQSELTGVSCVSDTDCTAVGDVMSSSMTTLVEHWNGSSWSIVASPNPAGGNARLDAVSCSSASSCIAVGRKCQSASMCFQPWYVTADETVFAERWDGSTWSISDVPAPAGSVSSRLAGIACATATDCRAVGSSYDGTSAFGLQERWDGSSWSITASPVTYGTLTDVSCPDANDCIAVGRAQRRTSAGGAFAERWNGSSWAVLAMPGVHGGLAGVSCAGATDCVAVGAAFVAPAVNGTLALHWNGSSWAQEQASNPAGTADNEFDGVACPSGGLCIAVGLSERAFADYAGSESSLIEQRLS